MLLLYVLLYTLQTYVSTAANCSLKRTAAYRRLALSCAIAAAAA